MENQTKTQTKKLYRSCKERMLAGVCGGIGEYFNIDPTLVRLFFVLLTLADGFGVLFYIILAIIIPSEPCGEKKEVKLEKQVEETAKEIGKGIETAAVKLEEEVKKTTKEISGGKSFFSEGKNMTGSILIIIGFIILVRQFFPIYLDWLRWDLFFPLALIVLGFHILLKNLRK